MPNEKQQQQPNQQQQQQPPAAPPASETPPATWEQWLERADEPTRALYEQHTAGLKSALIDERRQRGDLAAQLREAVKGEGLSAQLKADLETALRHSEEAEQRASFFEESLVQGVANARLAYLAAREIEAVDKKGRVNWDALKSAFPELFKPKSTPPPPGNAGAGTQAPPPVGGMNDFIRRAAGRQ